LDLPINPCPTSSFKVCRVKLVTEAGLTIPGYTEATVFTVFGSLVLTGVDPVVHIVVISK
jgi:hypothetical protein